MKKLNQHSINPETNLPYTEAERFNRQLEQTNTCWNWLGAKNQKGYGEFRDSNGILKRTNRYAWELVHGIQIPKGLNVLHTCDNPSCCRPSHLFLGTQQDNMIDCASKGRIKRKLTEEQVLFIRNYKGSIKELVLKFNVSKTTIGEIINGKTWKHLLS